MMAECDPNENEELDSAEASEAKPNFPSPVSSAVLFDRNRTECTLGLILNPGGAVRISDSCESVLTELEADGSSEEALLLPSPEGKLSPRGGKDKRSRRYRNSSSSDKENLASPGNVNLDGGGRTGHNLLHI